MLGVHITSKGCSHGSRRLKPYIIIMRRGVTTGPGMYTMAYCDNKDAHNNHIPITVAIYFLKQTILFASPVRVNHEL